MTYYYSTILSIEFWSLPENIRDNILTRAADQTPSIEYWSELCPTNNSWDESCNQTSLEEYYEDQKQMNNFKGTFEEFIIEYGLLLDKYLIDNNVNLKNVSSIILQTG